MATRFKVGLFTILGLLLIGALTVYVNHKPQWWRPCQLVHINVEDGTGLKAKSPIRSLGIEIGYLKTVDLKETHVDLGICITAPVEVLPSTRAYMRGEGFLGDKFVELKPVKYLSTGDRNNGNGNGNGTESPAPSSSPSGETSGLREPAVSASHQLMLAGLGWLDRAISSSQAAPPAPTTAVTPVTGTAPEAQTTPRKQPREGREIPVGEQSQDIQHLVNRVDELVNEMTNLTTNLKSAINPEELRSTMKQLNRTLENASRTLSPEGGLNQTAQRTLAKLEDAIEQLRDQMTRINKGEGSVGMLLNDPAYADEIRQALRNLNKLLSRAGTIRFVIDIGGEEINAYNGGRGYFRLGIFPRPDYYYLLGISIDPRGKVTQLDTTTTAGGVTTTTSTTQLEPTGILFTAMVGKILYDRLDLSLGAFNGDGAISTQLRLGPYGKETLFIVRNDVYSRGSGLGIDDRVTASFQPWVGSPNPWHAIYVKAGIEGFRTNATAGITPYFYGAGVTFDDEDIKLLFVLK
jgi:phospholipid/cholesterol/gamma-HCH transport system substrate-binding protein